MSDLLDFLEARLTEDERVAREATPGPWSWAPMPPPAKLGLVAGEQIVLLAAKADMYPDRYDADHIARHDPARVLREVEAKRAILALQDADHDSWFLPLLALPYADHPDYRSEWAPA